MDGVTSNHCELQWLVDLVKLKGVDTPKTIIFASNVNSVARIYRHLMLELGTAAFRNGSRVFADRMVDMFHSHSDEESLQRVQETFPKPGSHIRLVVSTVAFGIGVQIPDVKLIVHWGIDSSVLVYWQEVGRAGRNGANSLAITYTKPSAQRSSQELKAIFNGEKCLRQGVLEHFIGENTECSYSCDCMCCSVCAKKCGCIPMILDVNVQSKLKYILT